MCISLSLYIYIYTHVYIYIYIYIPSPLLRRGEGRSGCSCLSRLPNPPTMNLFKKIKFSSLCSFSWHVFSLMDRSVRTHPGHGGLNTSSKLLRRFAHPRPEHHRSSQKTVWRTPGSKRLFRDPPFESVLGERVRTLEAQVYVYTYICVYT